MRSWKELGPRIALAALLLASATGAAADGPVATAQQFFERCAYSDAIKTLRAALANASQDARIFYWLSRSAYELRDYGNAIQYGESAVRFDDRNSDYWLWLGKAYGRKADQDHSLGMARKTTGAFEKAVERDPSNIAARRALIEYLTEAPAFLAGGSKSKAREHIEILAKQDAVQGQLSWGYYWTEQEKYDRAEAAYRQALELKPKDMEAYFEVADFYQKRGDVARMEAVVEAAANVSGSDVRLNYYRGVARAIAGSRLEEAERLLAAYVEKACARSDWPSHASAHEWLGKVDERLGKKQEAIEHYRKTLFLDPRGKDAKEGLKRLQR
jgi:tetratricopeptide (TPR) repeat protein